MREHEHEINVINAHGQRVSALNQELWNRWEGLREAYDQVPAVLQYSHTLGTCSGVLSPAESKAFCMAQQQLHTSVSQLECNKGFLSEMFSAYHDYKNHGSSFELLRKKDAQLADAYTLIEELKGANKHLIAELAECKANRSLPSSSLDPAAPVATQIHDCQPRSTASVAFGDAVLQVAVAKVDLTKFSFGEEYVAATDSLPPMGPNDALVVRPEGHTPMQFGDEILRETMCQATSKAKIPEHHKAEPMIASFTLPNTNPKPPTTSMLPTMKNAFMGSVEATSMDDMPKRNMDEPISAASPMLSTLEKRSAGSSEDAGGFAPLTPDVQTAAAASTFASAAQTSGDSSHMLSATPLHHEATYCSEKWSSTWSCRSPVSEIWRMGYESRAVTVKAGPGQAYLDAGEHHLHMIHAMQQEKKARQLQLAQHARQAFKTFKRKTVRQLTEILGGNVEEAKRLFLQLQKESDERVRGACHHSFGQVSGGYGALNNFVKVYLRDRIKFPEPAPLLSSYYRTWFGSKFRWWRSRQHGALSCSSISGCYRVCTMDQYCAGISKAYVSVAQQSC